MPAPAEPRRGHPEEQALVGILRRDALPSGVPLDAGRLRALAAWHGLSGLAWRAAREAGHEELAGALEPDFRRIQAGNLMMLDRLRDLAALIRRTGIRTAVLKGAALIPMVYDRESDRPLSDVDLLIQDSDWPRLREALRRSGGYRLPGAETERRRLRYHHKLEVETAETPACPFEIHTDLEISGRRSLATADCLARSEPLGGSWGGLLRLAHQDMAFHLAVHAARHFSAPRLIWIHDLHRLHRSLPVDWAALARTAVETESRAAAWFTLRYLERVHPGTVPGAVVESLRPGPVRRGLFAAVRTDNPALPVRELWSAPLRWTFALALLDSAPARIRFLATHGFRRFVLGLPVE